MTDHPHAQACSAGGRLPGAKRDPAGRWLIPFRDLVSAGLLPTGERRMAVSRRYGEGFVAIHLEGYCSDGNEPPLCVPGDFDLYLEGTAEWEGCNATAGTVHFDNGEGAYVEFYPPTEGAATVGSWETRPASAELPTSVWPDNSTIRPMADAFFIRTVRFEAAAGAAMRGRAT